MHRDDCRLIGDNMIEPLSANTLLGKLVLALSVKSFQQDKVEVFNPDVYLRDGDTLDSYGVNASIIGLPGHTKGSIGIRFGNNDLFVGDALMNIMYPAKSLLYGNRTDMIKSAEKISTYKGVTIHFGHGKSVSNKIW